MCDTREFCRGRFQRYKGIELFFKRLAFNLGNSPSQTEVKIISCVPIDVTEMQARINGLQKELDELYKREDNAVHTALHVPTFNQPNYNNIDRNYNIQQVRPSPLYPNFGNFEDNNVASFNVNVNNNINRDPPTNTTYPNDNLTDTHSDIDTTAAIRNSSVTSLEYCEGAQSPRQNPIKNIFRKSKKPKRYQNDALVYHAKTINTPLMLQAKKRVRKNIPKSEEFFSRSYVRGLMRRQHEPGAKDTHSIQSTPVCRDVSETTCHAPRRYESDACSSCHVKFQDIDNYAPKLQHNHHFYTTNDTSSHSYYDDQLYDMVPVKDETKPKKVNIEVPAKYSLDQGHLDIGSPWMKRKPHPANNLKIAYQKYPRYKRDQVINKMLVKPSFCMVEYGDVYTKSANSDANIHRMARNKSPIRTKSVVLKINEGTNTVCETATETELTPEQPVEPKTEETLDQIKTILRSVLSEVKTTTLKQRNLNIKTDAVVQKDASQMDIYNKRSRLLQSYTYSPYDMNPYVASCNRQMAISSPTPNPALPYSSTYPYQSRCQTFPLIVQQSPILSKPFCASCSRQNPSFTRPYPIHTHPNSIHTHPNSIHAHPNSIHMHPNSIPTLPNPIPTNLANANKSSSRPSNKLNSETEQLIKEIYNSLNHDIIPSKEPEKVSSKNVSKKSDKTDYNLRRNVTLTTIKSASPFETMTNTSSSALDSSRVISSMKNRESSTRDRDSSTRDRDSYQTEVENRHVVERRHFIDSENKRVKSQSEVVMPQRSDGREHVFERAVCPHHHRHEVIEESEELLHVEPETEDESIYIYTTEDSDDGQSQVSYSEKPKGLLRKIGSVFKKKSAHGSKQIISDDTYRDTEILTEADDDDDEYPHGSRRAGGSSFRKPGKQVRAGATKSSNRETLLEKEYRQYRDELKMAKYQAMKNLPERNPCNYYNKNYLVQNATVDYEDPPRNRDEPHDYPRLEPVTTTTGQNYDADMQDHRKINYIKVISKPTDTKPKKTALSWLKQVKPKCGPEVQKWKKMIREL